jgi:N-acetylglutamate synthase-like GNAT family acetyltransferase
LPSESTITVRAANESDLENVLSFLTPFMDAKQILRRTSVEMELLMRHGFIAETDSQIQGFAAVEIYSKKLAEIQCLAVSSECRRKGIGRQLIQCCVDRAVEEKVREVMAITATDELFHQCGFDYSLPGQKRALFVQTEDLDGNE